MELTRFRWLNFAPTPDFQEWDHIAPNLTFQLGEGTPRPTYPIRFGVEAVIHNLGRGAHGGDRRR